MFWTGEDTIDFRVTEKYVTQGLEEIEWRVTKKIFQGFSPAENRMLGALSKLDKFLLNSQVLVQSGNIPGTSRDINEMNRELDESRSQNDPCPEVYHKIGSWKNQPQFSAFSSMILMMIFNLLESWTSYANIFESTWLIRIFQNLSSFLRTSKTFFSKFEVIILSTKMLSGNNDKKPALLTVDEVEDWKQRILLQRKTARIG